MWKLLRRCHWYVGSLPLLGLGGCFTSAQLQDFTRTEFARLTADFVGQILSLWVQAGSPFSVQ